MDLDEQRELVTESVAHVSNKISKSNDTFGERLANESEDYMDKKIVKSMDEYALPAMRWKVRKLRYAMGRFDDILNEEEGLRDGTKDKFDYI